MKRKTLLFFVSLLVFGLTVAVGQTPQPQAQAPKATIEGSVTRTGSGQPLKGARVTLRRVNTAAQARGAGIGTLNNNAALGALLTNLGGAAPASVSTDAGGRFTITGVDPGDYLISAEREGYVRSEFGQRTPTGNGIAVTVASSQRLTANLQMITASVISGRVLTPDGDPALNRAVQAYTYQYTNGQRALAQVGNVQTNDLGEYRLFGLQPGEYFVSVTSPELADQTAVGTLDLSSRSNAARGNDPNQLIQALAGILGERGGQIAQVLGGPSGNPPVYYPSTIDPDGASSITVAAGTEVRGIDFNLRPSRAATVTGKVVAPFPLGSATGAFPAPPPPPPPPPAALGAGRGGGRGNAATEIRQQVQLGAGVQINLDRIGSSRRGAGALVGLRLAGLGGTPVKPDGTFEIKGVAPGPYHLTATARDPNGVEHTARTRIEVGSADVNNVVVSLRPGVDVPGRIIVDTTAPQQFKMTSLRVSLVAEDAAGSGALNLAAIGAAIGGGRGNAAQAGAVAENGTFTLKDVGAMEYRVRIAGLPQGAYIQTGRIGSTDALSGPFTVDNSASMLQLQLGFTPGSVSGTATDASGAPAAGSQVVLVPDEARRGRSDAYFSTNSDRNGQFKINNVPPGSYKLFAWEDIPAAAYQYPDFIRRYEDRGQSITVNPNGTITANPRLIPAASGQ